MFRPPGLLAPQVAPTDGSFRPRGSQGFYVRAPHGSLPPRAPDMLAVRTEQLTAWGLSPHKIRSLVGCSPNVSDSAARSAEGVARSWPGPLL